MIYKTLAALVSAIGLAALPAGPASASTPPQRQHTVETFPFIGDQFRCGDLLLTANGGTYTETTDATLNNGTLHIHVVRVYADLTLVGSDGRTYRATAFAHERVTLVAPDFENPTFVKEVNGTTFYGGPNGSPGWVHEVLKINHGTRVDKVTGPCSFAD
jgi:hypothetical protein